MPLLLNSFAISLLKPVIADFNIPYTVEPVDATIGPLIDEMNTMEAPDFNFLLRTRAEIKCTVIFKWASAWVFNHAG